MQFLKKYKENRKKKSLANFEVQHKIGTQKENVRKRKTSYDIVIILKNKIKKKKEKQPDILIL